MKRNARRGLTALLCLCLCLSLTVFCPTRASADTEIGKLLTTTTYTPVALMELKYVTAATSTGGAYIAGYRWVDTALGTVVTDAFSTGRYRVEITVNTIDGFVFSGQPAVYLNNIPADYTLSADRRSLTLSRTYEAEIWAPSVVKNPSGERVDEGGLASFSATALYTLGYEWHAVDPVNHVDYPVTELPGYNGVGLDNPNRSTLNLYNVPASMDGWQIYCTFLGASWAKKNSQVATLRVNHAEPTPEPTPEATAAPEPSEIAEPTPEVTAPPTPEAAPEEHFHEFSPAWYYDDESHWHACSCGERADEGPHEMSWTLERRATKKEPGLESGACSVCGYTAERETAFGAKDRLLRLAPAAVGAAAVLALAVFLLKRPRKKAPPKGGGYQGRHVK